LTFINTTDEAATDAYEENGSWKLIAAKTGSYPLSFSGDPTVYPVVYFSVELERRPAYYIMNFVVPVIITSLMSLLVFLLPSEAGEKVSLQITVLLGYTVMMMMVLDITPRSSFNMPLLGRNNMYSIQYNYYSNTE
jgi:hypothetical protein